MEKLGAIPIPHLTDREILLLTYQQLQTVNEEFRADKGAKDILLHDLDTRMDKIERILGTKDALQVATDIRSKKQFQRIGIVFTVINLLVVVGGVLITILTRK